MITKRATEALVTVLTAPVGEPIKEFLEMEAQKPSYQPGNNNDPQTMAWREGNRAFARKLLTMGTPQGELAAKTRAAKLEIKDEEEG